MVLMAGASVDASTNSSNRTPGYLLRQQNRVVAGFTSPCVAVPRVTPGLPLRSPPAVWERSVMRNGLGRPVTRTAEPAAVIA